MVQCKTLHLHNELRQSCFIFLLVLDDICVFRCYAALGDIAKTRYLKNLNDMADKYAAETVSLLFFW